MTNPERQRSLDKKKWNESFKAGTDLSGKMDYCYFCKEQNKDIYDCRAGQDRREKETLCAKAFNRKSKKKA